MFEDINKDRIFIFFTGDSASEIDDSIFDKLKQETTICINRTFELFDGKYDPSYLFFSDKDVLYESYKYYKDRPTHPIMYARAKSKYEKTDAKFPELIPNEWLNNNIYFWDQKTIHNVPSNHNITPTWLFSILINNNYRGNVYIFGLDMYVKDGKYHFKNYHQQYYKDRKYSDKLIEFTKMLSHPYYKNLRLYNCNLKSNFKYYQFIDIKDVL